MDSDANLDRPFLTRFFEHGGKWQTRQAIIWYIGSISSVFQPMMIVFIGFQPKYVCTDNFGWDNFTGGVNSTDVFDDKCEVFNYTTNSSGDCVGEFQYDVGKHENIVSEWDLICGRAFMSEFSQVLYMIGMAVGSVTISPLADRVGRRWPYLGIRFAFILASFGIALSPNIVVFMIIRFIIGILAIAEHMVRFVFLMEISSVKKRSWVTIITGTIWVGGLCVQSLVAHLLRGINWRYLQAILSITTLSAIPEAFFVTESPLWLLATNRKKEANRILHAAMKMNGATPDFFKDKETKEMIETVSNENNIPRDTTTANSSKYAKGKKVQNFSLCHVLPTCKDLTLVQLIKSKTTRYLVIIVCFSWFVNSLVYYGIFLMSSAMAGDRILNFFLSSVVECPAILAIYISMRFFGRKASLISLHGLCAVALLLAGVFSLTLSGQSRDTSMMVVTFVGKFGISTTYSLVYAYTTEVFPTNFRASGLGMGSTSARFGSFLSPFSGALARELPWGPGIIFGGLCLVLTFLLCLVPETRERNLPQTVSEIEEWDQRK